MTPSKILIELHDVSCRFKKVVTLSQLDWQLRTNENWGVVGGNGAGKTTFLSLLRGDIQPAPEGGERLYYLNDRPRTSPIAFRAITGLVSCDLLDHYRKNGWNLSCLEAVCTGFYGTAFLYDRPSSQQLDQSRKLLERFGMADLSDRPILALSLGQARKILIARALVHQPKILFLDEVCAGLDVGSREKVRDILQQTSESGTQILYTSHERSQLPSFITHVLILGNGRIVSQGLIDRTEVKAVPKRGLNIQPPPSPAVLEEKSIGKHGETLIRIEHAQVWANGKRILHDLTWTMRREQNWALFGKNGAGKTTFMHLIGGEIQPAWGGVVQRFGDENPSTLWEIRRRIGFVSPDLQSSHCLPQTVLELALSGFYGSTGLHTEPTPEQIEKVRSWLKILRIEQLETCDAGTLSYGQLRIALILRALVTHPDILLLDEPLSGLDADARKAVLEVIDQSASSGISFMFVTHNMAFLPSSITHVAVMDGGRLIFQGTKKDYFSSLPIENALPIHSPIP